MTWEQGHKINNYDMEHSETEKKGIQQQGFLTSLSSYFCGIYTSLRGHPLRSGK